MYVHLYIFLYAVSLNIFRIQQKFKLLKLYLVQNFKYSIWNYLVDGFDDDILLNSLKLWLFGATYIWIIGIPAIIIIVSLRKEYRYDLLMINPIKFDYLEISIEKLNYETKMLNFYFSNQNIGSLLDGLVEFHQTYCT